MTLQEAIEARHSVRAYKGLPLAEDVVKVLEEQIALLNREGKLHIQLILNEPKAFQGTMAKYGRFRNEQKCVYQDMDGDDQKSIHMWLTVAGKIVAMARVCPAGTHMKEISIGRVITTERGKGYGKQIMFYAIDAAIDHFGAKLIDVEAQEYAKGFYESVGFKQSSDTFMLDGIPHIKMTWEK